MEITATELFKKVRILIIEGNLLFDKADCSDSYDKKFDCHSPKDEVRIVSKESRDWYSDDSTWFRELEVYVKGERCFDFHNYGSANHPNYGEVTRIQTELSEFYSASQKH